MGGGAGRRILRPLIGRPGSHDHQRYQRPRHPGLMQAKIRYTPKETANIQIGASSFLSGGRVAPASPRGC